MDTVAVLMSTFNGEKYLREQIDSILNQKDIEVQLFIRDDGSTDGTKMILNDYAAKFSNVHIEFGCNVGVGESFMSLLYSVSDTFDFYSFSDQDDIWLENKLCESLKLLKQDEHTLLYVSNQECVDREGVSLGLRWHKNDDRVFLNPEGILSQNVLCACTMVFTNKFCKMLVDETVRPSSAVLRLKNHDGWIALIAAMSGAIIFDNNSYMKYRQHGENVVGAYKTGFRKKLKAKFKKLFHSELRNYRSNTARELCSKFPRLTCGFPLIEICANSKKCKGKRAILKNQKELRSYTGEGYMAFRLKVLFGLF